MGIDTSDEGTHIGKLTKHTGIPKGDLPVLQNLCGSSHSYLQNLSFWDEAKKLGGEALSGAEHCAGDANCRGAVEGAAKEGYHLYTGKLQDLSFWDEAKKLGGEAVSEAEKCAGN